MSGILFWTSLLLLVYVYVGYPLVAWLRGHLCPRQAARPPIEPVVSVIVVAHDEAQRIGARIENLLASDYPAGKLEIIVASDGSTDVTAEIAGRYQRRGVKVRSFRSRRGKAAVLDDLIPSAKGEIVVLADARQSYEPGAIRALAADFADPRVGAVSGELMAPGFYWQYEKFIRANESWSDSTVGATGAIYAIRRELFESIPADTILDDVLIPVRIARRGYRVLFEARAQAYDVSMTPRAEFARKTRTIAGTFQLFARESWLLNPFRSRLWFEALSHKALRLGIPIMHAALFGANFALAGARIADEGYRWMMACQLLFYAAALAGHAMPLSRRRLVIVVPYTMCLLLWATMIGFLRFATRRQQVTWERVPVAVDS
ncbi:MAG TPA: glycosyltransferase family 2 protein [Vicinamibacterales bacterium]|jgi:cellulose synthase/poly-beta-1,6-N-acetylglucosamine synthase-like glycosyltransferase|nr:glycosyltransferase family 2 protein [Vicinamibacterales bacterium]